MSAKTPAPKIEFVEPIQADLGRPDLARKIFRFSFSKNRVFPRGIPPHAEGRTRRQDTLSCGLRWTWDAGARRAQAAADGEIVWSWRPDAGAKVAGLW